MTDTRRRLLATLRTPLGVLAVLACVLLLLLAALGPTLWEDAAAAGDPSAISRPPSPEHLFGTDSSGRDLWLRTLVATQLSVLMALAATAIGTVTGVLVGLLPFAVGRRLGRIVVAATNIGVAFPSLLLAIGLSVILGQSAMAATLAIALAMVPTYGRLTHNLAASVWNRDYVSAARTLGVPTSTVIRRHVLPNIRDPLLVNAPITAGGALLAFAGLSFLGLGIQVPEYDWGRMLNEGLTRIFVTPAAALVPGTAIILAGLTFVLLGELLSKALTPTRHRPLPRRVRRRLAGKADTAAGADTGSATAEPAGVEARPVLSVRDLRVTLPGATASEDRTLVDGVSLDIAPGEVVGVVGESGSGKSLTLMSVAGLLDLPLHVSAASAAFEDQPLTLRSGGHPRSLDHLLGSRLAMVFQDPMASLNPALSVGTQVAEPGRLHLDMSRSEAREAALARLSDVRIPDPERRFGQYPHEFSGGMRQRAMIATGLMGTPSLILADEPTTALDVTVQAEVLDLLRRINREHGTAIVLVSHDIAVIASLCSRALVMYRGRIVEDISAADLRAGNAQHPYTRALLATVPTMASERGRPLPSIPEDADFSAATEAAGADADDASAGHPGDGIEVVQGTHDATVVEDFAEHPHLAPATSGEEAHR